MEIGFSHNTRYIIFWQDLICDESTHAGAASLSVYPDSQAVTINEGKSVLSVYNNVDEKQKISLQDKC